VYALAAQEQAVALTSELERGARALGEAMAARASEGLIPPVEADLAAAEAVQLSGMRIEAERRRAGARAQLAALLGTSAEAALALAAGLLERDVLPVNQPSELEPLVAGALQVRADVAAADAGYRAAGARVDRLRWRRLPDPTLSVFAGRDGFDERIVGGGLSIPLPLPTPLGPSGRGEIQEAEALRRQEGYRLESVRRRVREEVTRALAEWRGRRALLDRYDPALIARARAHVQALGQAMQARQLAPREALVAQRGFIELLQGQLEARLAEATARVELMRAAGLPLPGVAP
jgi:cobalt-zinc-cadmium efflux system outer membrane protein